MSAELRVPGRGHAAGILRQALAGPHVAVLAGPSVVGLPRDTTFATTVVVIGGDVTVASRIRGDLVVVGGDLFLRPGAMITGRAVAIGGGVYPSLLANVGGGALAFREVTYDHTLVDGRVLLDQRPLGAADSVLVGWPGVYGLRVPTYDRANGLSLGAGPVLAPPGTSLRAEPTLTYRSHLGEVDPSLRVELGAGRALAVEAVAERGTYTNDDWSRADVLNSAATLVFGDDERNHYRATRYGAGLRVARERETFVGTGRLSLRHEEARSVGPRPGAASEPWSVFGRADSTRMLRPNPSVLDGRILSVLPQLDGEWIAGDLTASAMLRAELPVESVGDRRFVQTTADARVAFPAIAGHRFEGQLHVVLTAGDTAPPQRWAYLGGGSTLPTLDELSVGGDQLFFAEGLYEIPLPRLELPLVGSPIVGLRYAVGGAGVGELPRFTQNLAALVRVALVRLELVVDPASGRTAVRLGGSAFR